MLTHFGQRIRLSSGELGGVHVFGSGQNCLEEIVRVVVVDVLRCLPASWLLSSDGVLLGRAIFRIDILELVGFGKRISKFTSFLRQFLLS